MHGVQACYVVQQDIEELANHFDEQLTLPNAKPATNDAIGKCQQADAAMQQNTLVASVTLGMPAHPYGRTPADASLCVTSDTASRDAVAPLPGLVADKRCSACSMLAASCGAAMAVLCRLALLRLTAMLRTLEPFCGATMHTVTGLLVSSCAAAWLTEVPCVATRIVWPPFAVVT